MNIKKVIIESPYSGDVELNVEYSLCCMEDSYVNHNEAPYMSHLLYTRIPKTSIKNHAHPGDGTHVSDDDEEHVMHSRDHGIACGLAWGSCADATIVYTDLGISEGMAHGIAKALKEGRPVRYREIRDWAERKIKFEKMRQNTFTLPNESEKEN